MTAKPALPKAGDLIECEACGAITRVTWHDEHMANGDDGEPDDDGEPVLCFAIGCYSYDVRRIGRES